VCSPVFLNESGFDKTGFRDLTFDELLRSYAEIVPDKIAITYKREKITYRDLYTTSNRFAGFLLQHGIARGDVVGVAMDRSIDMAISLLGILKIGAAYLPIDAIHPKDRIAYFLRHSAAKMLLTSEAFAGGYSDYPQKLLFEEFLEDRSGDFPLDGRTDETGDNLAYIMYTSGSTGMPKGVEITQTCFRNLLFSMKEAPGLTDADVVLSSTTISFDIAQLEIFLPLISGARLHIVDYETARDGRRLLEVIKTEKISMVQATPFTWRIMLESGWEEKLPIKALIGGEALPKELADKLVSRCNELWNMYGPTETTIWSLIKKISPQDKIITIGRPIANTEVYLLDEHLAEVPPGEVGEIYIGGTGVGRGYVNSPELTAKAFLPDTFSGRPGGRIYKTGDLGKLAGNGEIQCLGRIDHQIKIHGFRIETDEIEFKLRQLPYIKHALVVAQEDALNITRLIAYVVPSASMDEDRTEDNMALWRAELRKALPEYMLPSFYMVIAEIPLLASGKVNRKALPAPDIKSNRKHHAEPQSEMESRLAALWSTHIGVPEIGTNDNFFELGGNSLVAVKVMLDIEKLTGKRLPVATLFQYPTVNDLASFIQRDALTRSLSSIIVPIKDSGAKLPLYIIHGIGLNLLNLRSLALNMDTEQPVFGFQAVGLDGTGDKDALESMEEIAALYVRELLTHNPSGQYAIAGYSFGGFIAYEMAKQLKQMGKEVLMLGMIDTNIQIPTNQYTFVKKVFFKGIRQFAKLGFRIRSILAKPAENIQYLKHYFSRSGHAVYGNEIESENMPPFMQEIAHKYKRAFDKYRFRPLNVQIDLFKARERIFHIDDGRYQGWKKYALNGVNVYVTPGDHKHILSGSNVKILAMQMQTRLNELKATSKKKMA
jgi:amino acid adenylation domain-containing protein